MPAPSAETVRPLTPVATQPTLQMIGVSKRYHRGGETVVALDQADIAIEPGEFCALIGPSGSGKSTLLHIAGGIDRPDEGTVLVDGQDPFQLSAGDRARQRRRGIGFVFQFFHLIPTLSVVDNVALPLILDSARNTGAAAEEMLRRVGLAHRTSHRPGELSGGEMQRAAIARALVARPRLILADEPTGNLDSVTGQDVLGVLVTQVRDLNAGLLLVTHDPAIARQADRVVSLRDGKLS